MEGDIVTFGAYVPMLLGIRSDLKELKNYNFKICRPLLDAVRGGFRVRFDDLLDPFNVLHISLKSIGFKNKNQTSMLVTP